MIIFRDFLFPRDLATPLKIVFSDARVFFTTPFTNYKSSTEAICCALEPERITPSFNTRHQSYSPESSSSFILPPSTHQKTKKSHFRARLLL